MFFINRKLAENRMVSPEKTQIPMHCASSEFRTREVPVLSALSLFSLLRRLKKAHPQPGLTASNSRAAPFPKTNEADTTGGTHPDCDSHGVLPVSCSSVALATAEWIGGHLTLERINTFSFLGIRDWDSSTFTFRQSLEERTHNA